MNKHRLAIAIAIALSAPVCALAQDQTEIDDLRQQIQELKDRLDAQEAKDSVTPEATSLATDSTAVAEPSGRGQSGNAFNPAISLIIDAKYNNVKQNPDGYYIGGFVPGAEESGTARGFNLDESELTISSNIDPYWLGYFTTSLSDGEVGVEEAWIQNSGTIPGVVAKLGRFLSAIGYLNQTHPHAWDFTDAPLVQQAFFGGELADDGVQLRYIAPTPVLLEFGLEGGRGANFPGSERNKNGANAGTIFANLGGDIGFSNSYLIRASYRQTRAAERSYEDVDSVGNDIENIFSDLESKIWGASFVWKWAPDGDPSIRNFKFQSEYFRRKEDGQLGYNYDAGTDTFAQEGNYSSNQNGWYAQGVWQFMPRWRVGARYDQLDSGTMSYQPITDGSISREDLQLLQNHKPKRYTAMVDFSTSEFARFRLQYEYDEVRYDLTDQLITFQYVVSLGAHGAHKF